MVLKVHVVRQGGHHYYVDDLVPGRAEGSLVAGEEPGVWVGAAHRSLGLEGRVEPEPFADVLEGRHPLSGRSLGNRRGQRSAAGYDLTFSAPKSVSLLHLLAPGELASEVGAGHQAAVDGSLEYLGREGVGVRRTRKGVTSYLPSTGMVAGEFLHRTSRTLDPHLHTHVVLANLAEGVDGAWSAVDSRRLFTHLGASQALYHARLRLELGHRIGASWEVRPTGLGDVVGVDVGLRRLFSQRSASMDQYRFYRGASRGVTGSSAAFHADRPDKNRSVTVEELRSEWRRRAAELGFDLGDLTRAVGPHRDRGAAPVIDHGAVINRLDVLTDHRRTVARHHLVAVVASSAPGGADVGQIESLASRWLEAAGSPVVEDDRGDPGRARPEQRWEAATVKCAVERAVGAQPATVLSPDEEGADRSRAVGRDRSASTLGIDPRLRSRDSGAAALVMAMPDRSWGVDR
ncbi:MAG TPA: MobF family relaxase [Acidimicrobiales bacterium]|nr:MobF family relaxase [Acidimicrobiales bacterium]